MIVEGQRYSTAWETVEILNQRARASFSGTADGAGALTLSAPAVAAGFAWDLRRAVFDGPTTGIARLYAGAPTPDSLIAIADLSSLFAPGRQLSFGSGEAQIPSGDRLILVCSGAGAGTITTVALRYDILQVIQRPIDGARRTPGAGTGFPAIPDSEDGLPSQDAPMPEDIYDRNPAGDGAGVGSFRTDRAGWGSGALYPERPADVSAPAAFPWPDGAPVPGGDY